MLANMDRLSSLPDTTQVYCAHEYTLNNYKFLNSIDSSVGTGSRLEEVTALREQNIPTVPSTIGLEKDTNLFMKCREDRTMGLLKANSPVEAMHKLRELKNIFSY